MILIKENHIRIAGGIENAIKKSREFIANRKSDVKIEIEVTCIDELEEALLFNPDRIMLDNFSIEDVLRAVELAGKRVEIEISGGIDESNIRKYAEAGPDYISVGKITASAPALDLSMLIR